MYKLINDEEITNSIKNAFKKGITRGYLRVLPTQTEEELIINEENYLQSIDFDDYRYVESEGIIGTVIAKGLNGKFINVDFEFDIEDREIECYIGAEVGNSTKYLRLGTFIVQKPENDNVKDNTTFEAFDYMIKFNKEFQDRLDYSSGEVTIGDLLEDICDQCGVVCGTSTFRNSDFILENNQFVNGETCRDVLKAIAQVAFSWARINEDDELVLDFDIIDNITEEIDYDEYIELKINNQYGPLNTIVFRNSQIEGENYTIVDPNKQPEDEICELVISDNPFAYTQDKRQQLIQAGSAIFGFTYIPISIKTIGTIYLNCIDKIRIKNMQDNYLTTYIFNNKIKYDGTIHDDKQTPAITKSETKYKFLGNISEKIRRTEFMVDKQNQKIESVVNTVTKQNNKISQITQSVDELNTKIQDIADITTFGESTQAIVELENVNESEPISINIHPIGTNISYLYPIDNLYPSDNLFMTDRKIRFIRTYDDEGTTKTENIDYELPDDLLYYDSENYDEFILNYDSQTCQVRKKCKYNADGTVGLLANEVTTDYTYPLIQLGDGDYEVKLLGYNVGYLAVRLMAKNIYTTQFATRVEMRTEISETAQGLQVEIDKKLDETELGLKIQANYESVQIAWNNISEYIQFANAELQILNSSHKKLMTLNQTGQHFFDGNNNLIGDMGIINYRVEGTDVPMIAFNLNVSQTNDMGMAWGIQKGNNYYPIFYCVGSYAEDEGEYGGYLYAPNMEVGSLETVNITSENINTLSLYVNDIYTEDDLEQAPRFHISAGGVSHMGYPVVSHNTNHIITVDYVTSGGNTVLAFYVDGQYYGGI